MNEYSPFVLDYFGDTVYISYMISNFNVIFEYLMQIYTRQMPEFSFDLIVSAFIGSAITTAVMRWFCEPQTKHIVNLSLSHPLHSINNFKVLHMSYDGLLYHYQLEQS